MFKPTILPYWPNNPYKEQTKQVGIYKDTMDIDDSEVKVLIQRESLEVVNDVEKIIKHASRYDLILTWNEEILNKCSNAKKFIHGDCWISPELSKIKKDNYVSFLTSDKSFTSGHILRQRVYEKLKGIRKIGGYKMITIKTPPRIPDKNIIFENCKFSIIMENSSSINYFTEKTVDCFMAKTVPIYWGCPNIGDYFNKDGMIFFQHEDELKEIIENLENFEYDKKSNILEENFMKAQQYADLFSRVDEEVSNFLISWQK
jgi:hypothetical protein